MRVGVDIGGTFTGLCVHGSTRTPRRTSGRAAAGTGIRAPAIPSWSCATVVNGYASIDAARDAYGVAVCYAGAPDALVRTPETYELDAAETARLRSA